MKYGKIISISIYVWNIYIYNQYDLPSEFLIVFIRTLSRLVSGRTGKTNSIRRDNYQGHK